jgi:CheY-like chemotaxis protein
MEQNIAKILLIDDDNTTNYLHKKVISKTNLCSSLIVANDGEKGVEALLEMNNTCNSSDGDVLIFLDLNMPIMDGWEFLSTLDKIKDEIKFNFLLFVVSSSVNGDDIDRAEKNCLVTKYLKKPINIQSIENIKSEYLNC